MSDDVRRPARPLRDAADLDPLLERIGEARIVAVGEASHGTSEYYTWRAALTRRLVEERGFGVVAVEGDRPDCYRVDRSVRLRPGADEDRRTALDAISRWPTWMWADDEVVDSCRWLRGVDHRAIGVVHRPGRKGWGDDVPTVLGERYGASLYPEDTSPLRPLHMERADEHVPPSAHVV